MITAALGVDGDFVVLESLELLFSKYSSAISLFC